MVLVPVLLLWKCCFDKGSPKIPRSWPLSTAFFSCRILDTEKMMKSVATWYSTGSSWADLPNGRKIRGWLYMYQFPGKLALHPDVGVTPMVTPNWRLVNSYGILPAAVQPGTHLLLNNLNSVDREILWYPPSTLYFLDSWGSQQWKERIITGAGLGQPGKSYHAVPTGEFNWRTSENPCVIASIEAPLKSAVWRSKFVIFHTCLTFFWNFLVALCTRVDLGLAVLACGPFALCLIHPKFSM
jgi:hypothetical protein